MNFFVFFAHFLTFPQFMSHSIQLYGLTSHTVRHNGIRLRLEYVLIKSNISKRFPNTGRAKTVNEFIRRKARECDCKTQVWTRARHRLVSSAAANRDQSHSSITRYLSGGLTKWLVLFALSRAQTNVGARAPTSRLLSHELRSENASLWKPESLARHANEKRRLQ